MRLLPLALLALLATGCATTTTSFAPVKSGSTEIQYERGQQFAWSKSVESAVMMSAFPATLPSDQRPAFIVTVVNGGKTPVVVDVTGVSVTLNGAPVAVVTADQLLAESKSRETWAQFGNALAAAGQGMSAANAGTTYHTGTANTQYMNNYGRPIGSSSTGFSGTSYNQGAVQAAQRDINAAGMANSNAIAAGAGNERSQIADTAFQTQTVNPGKTFTGAVHVERGSAPNPVNVYKLDVRVGSETHQFEFTERASK